jgi:hypothetical protein
MHGMRGVRIPVGGNTRAAHKHSTLKQDPLGKEKPSMTTNAKDPNTNDDSKKLDTHSLTRAEINKNRKTVDRGIRTMMNRMESENTAAQETPNTRVQRVLEMYRNVKPALVAISILPIIPLTWRTAILMFNQALDGLAVAGNSFKAGKDI